jgi:DNA polymerase III subunit delta'
MVDGAGSIASRACRYNGVERIVSSDNGGDGNGKLPRQTTSLFGHSDAEQALLEAYRSGRFPHAWLIGGPPGIGKATLAYRVARFVFAHPDPRAPAVQQMTSLTVDPSHPVARRVATQAHGDLLVLERTLNEQTGKLYTAIRVDDVRRTVSFFGSTAGEGGWRIAIVDAIDDLQREGANALLKVLEDPPQRSLLLLISNALGRELPTIRSRCRRLLLRPLAVEDVALALSEATGKDAAEPDVRQASEAAEGSVGRALALLDGSALALRQRILELFAQLPNPNPRALHALGEAIGGTDPKPLETFMDLINGWLSARLSESSRTKSQMAHIAETWEKVNRAAREAETYNLERKPLVFSVFDALAEGAQD